MTDTDTPVETYTEYHIHLSEDPENPEERKNPALLELIEKTKTFNTDAANIAKGGYYLMQHVDQKEMERVKKLFDELGVALSIDEEKICLVHDITPKLLEKLYLISKDKLDEMTSLIFEFYETKPGRYALGVYDRSGGDTFYSCLRHRKEWRLNGGFTFDFQGIRHLKEEFSADVIGKKLDRTMDVFTQFAASKGLDHTRSLGVPETNEKIFHIWAGKRIGYETFTLENCEEEWSQSILGELGRFCHQQDWAPQNVVLYFGNEGGFELFYIENKNLNGTDEELKAATTGYGFLDGEELGVHDLILSAEGTPLNNPDEMARICPGFQKVIDRHDEYDSKYPNLSAMELVLYRIFAKIGAGLYESDFKVPEGFRIFSVFHGMESKIDWKLRAHAQKTIDLSFEAYLAAWFETL